MSRFAGENPRRVHHLPRDPEFLIELPEAVQITEIAASQGAITFSGGQVEH
jgi:hypothetical protein